MTHYAVHHIMGQSCLAPKADSRDVGQWHPWSFGLQWDLDQLIEEMYEFHSNIPLPAVLQWGRDQLIAEMSVSVSHTGDSVNASIDFGAAGGI
jgi:hypothetical protein